MRGKIFSLMLLSFIFLFPITNSQTGSEPIISVKFYPLAQSLSYVEYLIRVSQCCSEKGLKVNLGVIVNETSFPIEDLKQVRLWVYDNETYLEDVWISNITCENQTTENGTKLICVDNGYYETQEKWHWIWNDCKEQYFKRTAKTFTSGMGTITIPDIYTHDHLGNIGTKWFKIRIEFPLSWSSSGMFGIQLDEKFYHPWWNTSWNYRIPCNISEDSGNDLINYPTFCVLDTKTLIIEDKLNKNCSDLRVVNTSEDTEIDFYIEPDANTVALFHFDENSGSFTDDETLNHNDGEISGAVWTTGKFDYALDFDGVDDYIKISDPQNLDLINGTIEAWIYPKNLIGVMAIVAKGTGPSNLNYNYALQTNDTGLRFLISDGSSWQLAITSLGYLTINTWQHVAVSWDGSNIKFYVNGILKETKAQTITPASTPNALWIGNLVNSGEPTIFYQPFNGTIDEVRISDQPRSGDDISQYYGNETEYICLLNSQTKIWFKVNVSANTNQTYYIYYDNPTATPLNKEHKDVRYNFYDDFSDLTRSNNLWTYNSSYYSVDTTLGVLKAINYPVNVNNHNYHAYTNSNFDIRPKVNLTYKLWANTSSNTIQSIVLWNPTTDMDGYRGEFSPQTVRTWDVRLLSVQAVIESATGFDGVFSKTTWTKFTLEINQTAPEYLQLHNISDKLLELYNSSWNLNQNLKIATLTWDASTDELRWDNIILLKWTDPEPTYYLGSEEATNQPPVVSLNFPTAYYNTTNTTIQFKFTPTDDKGYFDNCSLYSNITGSWAFTQANQTAITNNTLTTITYDFNSDGYYVWNIYCCDNESECAFASANLTFTRDTTPPVIERSEHDETTSGIDIELNKTVKWYAYITDLSAINWTKFEFTYPNGTSENFTISESSSWFNFTKEINSSFGVGDFEVRTYTSDWLNHVNSTTFPTLRTSQVNLSYSYLPVNFTSRATAWGNATAITNDSTTDFEIYLVITFDSVGTANITKDITINLTEKGFSGNKTLISVLNSTGDNITYTYNDPTITYTSEWINETTSFENRVRVKVPNALYYKYAPSGSYFRYYLEIRNFTKNVWNYIRIALPTEQQFNPSLQHLRYWVCLSGQSSDFSCSTWASSVDVYSTNLDDNSADGYKVNMYTEGTIDFKDKIVFNASYQSPFLLQISRESGAETIQQEGGGGGGGLLPTTEEQVEEEGYCGDGVCQINEDAISCPQDCKPSLEITWSAKLMLAFIGLSMIGIAYYHTTYKKKKSKKSKFSLKLQFDEPSSKGIKGGMSPRRIPLTWGEAIVFQK